MVWLVPSDGESILAVPLLHECARDDGRVYALACPVEGAFLRSGPEDTHRERGLSVGDLAMNGVQRLAHLEAPLDACPDEVLDGEVVAVGYSHEFFEQNAVWAAWCEGAVGRGVLVHKRAIMLDLVVFCEVVEVELPRETPPAPTDQHPDCREEDAKGVGDVVDVMHHTNDFHEPDVQSVVWPNHSGMGVSKPAEASREFERVQITMIRQGV